MAPGFPDKNYIRQVYRLLGDFFGLEEGLGHGLAFEFDPEHFVKTYKLELTTTLSAMETLQVAGVCGMYHQSVKLHLAYQFPGFERSIVQDWSWGTFYWNDWWNIYFGIIRGFLCNMLISMKKYWPGS